MIFSIIQFIPILILFHSLSIVFKIYLDLNGTHAMNTATGPNSGDRPV